jgi:DNA-binding transcriptional MerR regulator
MKTIRSWDNRGLFPSLKDENNRKYYSREQIKAKLISLGAKEYGKE